MVLLTHFLTSYLYYYFLTAAQIPEQHRCEHKQNAQAEPSPGDIPRADSQNFGARRFQERLQ